MTGDDTTEIRTRLLGREVVFPLPRSWLAYWLFVLRVVVGWWLLHAGLDKVYSWPFDASWYLGGAASGTSLGPFLELFSSGPGLAFTNVAVPIGQLLIGLGLVLGAFTRAAAFFGAFQMTFFYFVNGETGGWAHGLVTGELLGLLLMAMIATLGAGRVLGVDALLADTELVRRHPRLESLIG